MQPAAGERPGLNKKRAEAKRIVVNAHAVALALRLQDSIVTADEPDFSLLTHHLGGKAPRVHPWL